MGCVWFVFALCSTYLESESSDGVTLRGRWGDGKAFLYHWADCLSLPLTLPFSWKKINKIIYLKTKLTVLGLSEQHCKWSSKYAFDRNWNETRPGVQCTRLCHDHCMCLRYSSSNALTCQVDCSSESGRRGEQRLVCKTSTELLISSADIQRGLHLFIFIWSIVVRHTSTVPLTLNKSGVRKTSLYLT